jgi:4-alpha-glucanotransferase
MGIGDLGPQAAGFLDWLEAAGQSVWQVLPLGPVGFGNSPYNASSTFAGNPMLISPDRLVEASLLPPAALEKLPVLPAERIDFRRATEIKNNLLRTSWEYFVAWAPAGVKDEVQAFCEAPEQRVWLDDWALFAALKTKLLGRPWQEWPQELATRSSAAMAETRRELEDEIAYHRYLQFLFFRQWSELKTDANHRGIRIFGDLPFYVALDSADVWANPRLFSLDDDAHPVEVAGVPPDYFSATGQLWGNPVYRWDRLQEEGYGWWIDRLRNNLRLTNLLRIDHFRAFVDFWQVPAGEQTAINGRWVPGPGRPFFDAVGEVLGELPIVAEDLGIITDEVRELRRSLGVPGMKVLQFGFDTVDNEHLPHRVTSDTVYYTGTHDNDTAVGWHGALGPEQRQRVRVYLGHSASTIHQIMIRTILTSVADLAVIPMQDVLGLGSDERMNRPGDPHGNWEWRLQINQLSDSHAAWLRELTELSGRLP